MPKRTGLTERGITERALEMVDRDGIDGLSMRKLAGLLDVSPMTLYTYFADREALLEAVTQLIYAKIDAPENSGGSRDTVRRLMHSVRNVLLAHPNALPLIPLHPPRTLEALVFVNAGHRALREAGVGPLDTARAYRALAAYSIGTASVEVSRYFAAREADSSAYPSVAAADLERLLPHVAEVAPLLGLLDDTAEFDYGLDLTLDGVMQRHGAE
ncbi:MAG: TetR/AcrR family transcriptional regulator [Nocardioidaceae bacterium]